MAEIWTLGVAEFVNFSGRELAVKSFSGEVAPPGANGSVLILNEMPAGGREAAETARAAAMTASAVALNSDLPELCGLLAGTRCFAVTYGFNEKACVTVSSLDLSGEAGRLQACVLRAFRSLSGETVTRQEFNVALPRGVGAYDAMASLTAFLIYN
ncbi:MAG: hypothetical protein LBU36_06365 [Clostridiales bacterium]|jgi:hypothetical protein|nr:hypothetical protein [Clostridiales bacterium]